MRRTRLLGALVFVWIVGLGLALYGQSSHPSEDFVKYCAKCHGTDGKAQTQRGKNRDAEMIEAVTEGKDEMPPFGKKLTKEQIESLVKFDVRGFAPKK